VKCCLLMPSLDSTLSSLMQPLPCQAPTTSCQASVRLGQALLIPRRTANLRSFWTSINLHSYLCRVKAHLHAALQARQSNLCRVKPHPCHVTLYMPRQRTLSVSTFKCQCNLDISSARHNKLLSNNVCVLTELISYTVVVHRQ